MNGGRKAPGSGSGVAVAYVTCEPRQPMWEDDLLSAEALAAHGVKVEFVAWDDPDAGWRGFDRVIVRSAWDYADRLDDFLAWCDRIGPGLLRNTPDLIRWNSDKRYLAELDGSGLPVPPTLLVAPLGPVPDLHGEVVVKPVVGAGARDTGRFRPGARAGLLELLESMGRRGRIAMIQPYLHEIEETGETGLMFFGGEFAYALKKRAFLEPDRVAPAEDGPGPASAMTDETLVSPGEADPGEIGLGRRTVEWIAGKFGRAPLYLRVDTLLTEQGPVLMEVEAIEPGFYLDQAAGLDRPGAELFAGAVITDLDSP